MQSIAVYGRLVVRAVLSELTSDLPRSLPWHGSGIAATQSLRRSFHLVTAASGLSKTHSTLASSQNLLKPRTYGDDACFVARHKLGDVIGQYYLCRYDPREDELHQMMWLHNLSMELSETVCE